MNKRLILLCCLWFPVSAVFAAGGGHAHLDKAPINLEDKASLQRGAKYFMNYCVGCHSAHYVRYKGMAKDIGIVDEAGNVAENIVLENLVFNDAKVGDTITHAMPAEDAAAWFGTAPPDLSLIAREKGVDYLYTYLRSFYQDKSRPWGVNNAVFKDVGMPHVLLSLQGTRAPIFETRIKKVAGESHQVEQIVGYKQLTKGSMTEQEYDQMSADLVNFLAYIGEPAKLKRERLGVWVLLFLTIFTVFAYLLKKEYWKDVH